MPLTHPWLNKLYGIPKQSSSIFVEKIVILLLGFYMHVDFEKMHGIKINDRIGVSRWVTMDYAPSSNYVKAKVHITINGGMRGMRVMWL